MLENEIIKINYDGDEPTVSARELYESLSKYNDFIDFYVEVSKLKVSFCREELRQLQEAVKMFALKFGSSAIVYLEDSISTEMTLPCKSKEARKDNESNMKIQIVNNFKKIFPDYSFVCCEKAVEGIGRIDIFATYKERAVIIELKTGNRNPNSQLIAYGSKFENPILIGITEQEIGEEKKLNNIEYFTFNELKEGVEQWII